MGAAAVSGEGAALAVALGIGVLLGAERERHKGRGPDRGAAGVRTFALASRLGALGALLGSGARVAAVAFVGAASLVGYRRGEDPGLTTNTITTAVLAGALGGRRYAWRVVVGLVLVLAAAWAGGMLAS